MPRSEEVKLRRTESSVKLCTRSVCILRSSTFRFPVLDPRQSRPLPQPKLLMLTAPYVKKYANLIQKADVAFQGPAAAID